MKKGLELADVVITTGGTSMGEGDLVKVRSRAVESPFALLLTLLFLFFFSFSLSSSTSSTLPSTSDESPWLQESQRPSPPSLGLSPPLLPLSRRLSNRRRSSLLFLGTQLRLS